MRGFERLDETTFHEKWFRVWDLVEHSSTIRAIRGLEGTQATKGSEGTTGDGGRGLSKACAFGTGQFGQA